VFALDLGRSATAWLDRADAELARAAAIDPTLESMLEGRADAARIRSEDALVTGVDPQAAWASSRAAFDDGMRVNPEEFFVIVYRAEAELAEAAWMLAHARSPANSLAGTERLLARAIALDDKRSRPFLDTARLQLVRARWQHQPAAIAAGLAAVDRALALDPDTPEALALRGALELVAAEADPARRAEHASRGRDQLAEAIRRNRWLDREFGPLLREATATSR
jgi:hypothetical protein